MAKRIILWVLIILAIVSISWMGYRVTLTIANRKHIETQLKSIPVFTVKTPDSSKLIINKNIPSVFIYFNTDCDHCQYEAIEIGRNILKFKNAQLLMLSIEPLTNIRKFIKTYKLEGLSNLQIGQISGKTAVETFGFKSVPHILIYNSENQLVKEYKGETKIEAILKYL